MHPRQGSADLRMVLTCLAIDRLHNLLGRRRPETIGFRVGQVSTGGAGGGEPVKAGQILRRRSRELRPNPSPYPAKIKLHLAGRQTRRRGMALSQ
ncbi:MAG: hypothetical protein U0R19_02055 [Bryobacteraceae bacterium]